MKMILGMFFLLLDNVDIEFVELKTLIQRFYDTAKALPITSQVELINKREFIKVMLDENFETFVVYMVILEAKVSIYPLQIAQ